MWFSEASMIGRWVGMAAGAALLSTLAACASVLGSTDSAKGYGFIQSDEGKDIFVHYTGIERDGFKALQQGQEVNFQIADGKRGPQATKVKVVD
jgi:CspA family cold shock protein